MHVVIATRRERSDSVPLEDIQDPEARTTAKCLRELIEHLGEIGVLPINPKVGRPTHEYFAQASGVLERAEVSQYVNGKVKGRAVKLARAIANAASISLDVADRYLQGEASLVDIDRDRVAQLGRDYDP